MAIQKKVAKSPKESGTSGSSPSIRVTELAKLFNITPTRINQLENEGVVFKVARGSYDQWRSIKGYISYLQDRRVNQWDSKDEDQTDLKREQLRRTKEEADKLSLVNARTRGELVEVAMIRKLGEKVMSAVRNRIINMPLTDDEKDKCLRDLLQLAEMDWSRES